MTSVASSCCTGRAEPAHNQHGSAPSLSHVLWSIFCCGADKAEGLKKHADGAGSGSSESEDPADFLPEGSSTEAAEEEEKSTGRPTEDLEAPLSPADARNLADKMAGDFVVLPRDAADV
jgi:hypothetical protein